MSCGVGCRRGSDPAVLWLWLRPVATAPIQSLAWEPPYAAGAAQERATITTTTTTTKKTKDKKKKKKKKKKLKEKKTLLCSDIMIVQFEKPKELPDEQLEAIH